MGTCILLGSAVLACSDRFSTAARGDGGPGYPRDANAVSDGSRFSRGGAAANAGGSRNAGGGDAQSGGSENGGGSSSGGNGGNTGGGGAAGDTGEGGAAMGGKAGMASGGTGTGGRGTGGKAGSGGSGATCQDGDPKCSDGTCSRLSWNFDSGSLEGVVRVMSPHPPVVRDFNGNPALATDVDQLNQTEVRFALPICNSGTVDLHSKTLTFRVYFDGAPASALNFYVQTASPDPRTDAYLDQIGASTGVWTTYSSPLSKSKFSTGATSITIQAGSLGAAFSGTIWFDDFAIR